MTPTRPSVLVQLVLGFALLVYVLAAVAYSELPRLPVYAPVSMVLLTLAELGMAKVVRDRLSQRHLQRAGVPALGRPLEPMQVARAAVLAKASSTGGAVLLGCYAGLLVWTLPRAGRVEAVEQDALVAGLSALASAALVAAALALERACRTPEQGDEPGPPAL